MKIGGKERPIKIGLNQSIEYCELRGISITQMNDDLARLANGSGSEMRDYLWSALKDGARVSKTDFSHSNLDVGDWLEDVSQEELSKFIGDITGSMPKGTGKKKEVKEQS